MTENISGILEKGKVLIFYVLITAYMGEKERFLMLRNFFLNEEFNF